MNFDRQTYEQDVHDLAVEFLKLDGTKDYDLAEVVDDTQWLIYNAGNYAVIQHSSNEDAIFSELGSDASECYAGANSFQQVVQWTAAFAMQADVRQRADELKKEVAK